MALASAPAPGAQDTGGSHNLLLKASIGDDWFVISRSNVATRNNFGDAFLGYSGASLGYQITPALSLRLGYRRAWFRFAEDWQPENRAMLEAYFADRIEGFRLTNRLRAELRYFDWRDDDIRLRNEITLEAPWELTPLSLRLYLEEEVSYSTNAGRFEANWLGGGLAWRPAAGGRRTASRSSSAIAGTASAPATTGPIVTSWSRVSTCTSRPLAGRQRKNARIVERGDSG